MPSIRADLVGGRIVVTANGDVTVTQHVGDIPDALAAWGDTLATVKDVRLRAQAPGWCSWYCHGPAVTAADVATAVDAVTAQDLDVRVIQIDDGYQADIGDWLDRNTAAFPTPLTELTGRIADAGMEAGLWTAPFCVGADSALARAHPEWLVDGALASDEHWGQPIRVLDVTHPGAADHLHGLFATLRSWGFAYHKVDFVYAGALPGGRHGDASPLDAYGEGLRIIRDAIGEDATLLGCGAPLLPSVGRVDAMRVSPDIDPVYEPPKGDVSQPSMQGALQAGACGSTTPTASSSVRRSAAVRSGPDTSTPSTGLRSPAIRWTDSTPVGSSSPATCCAPANPPRHRPGGRTPMTTTPADWRANPTGR